MKSNNNLYCHFMGTDVKQTHNQMHHFVEFLTDPTYSVSLFCCQLQWLYYRSLVSSFQCIVSHRNDSGTRADEYVVTRCYMRKTPLFTFASCLPYIDCATITLFCLCCFLGTALHYGSFVKKKKKKKVTQKKHFQCPFISGHRSEHKRAAPLVGLLMIQTDGCSGFHFLTSRWTNTVAWFI